MDNKNVFIAIALSMSVLLFWGAFFETPRKSPDQQTNQKIEKKTDQGSITPTINQPQVFTKLTREESINKNERVITALNGLEAIDPAHGDGGKGESPRKGDLGEDPQQKEEDRRQPAEPRKDFPSLEVHAEETDPTAQGEGKAHRGKLQGEDFPQRPEELSLIHI